MGYVWLKCWLRASLLSLVAGVLTVLTCALSHAQQLESIHAQEVRLLSPAKHKKLQESIPRTDSELLEKLRTDPRLILFTKDEVPPVFQAADNNRANNKLGVFRAGTTFTVGGVTVGGGSNQFPWRVPAGLGDAVNWDSFQFLWLPPGEAILWGPQRLAGDRGTTRSITWTYPDGTVLGEVLGVLEPGDLGPIPFELRVRRKIAEGDWRVDLFRPFRTRDELDLATAVLGSPLSERFVQTRRVEVQSVNQSIFHMLPSTMAKDFLPSLEPATVRRLLDNTFVSVRGHEWSDGALAPDTQEPFHIIPRFYNGAFLNVTDGTCRACHKTAGQNISLFSMPAPSNWDEWVRGNGADQSMTFHPFHPDSISTDGTFKPVAIRGDLVKVGILKRRER